MEKETHEVRNWVITIGVLLALIIGFRLVWAKLIYQDMRCAFAECRIQVNP